MKRLLFSISVCLLAVAAFASPKAEPLKGERPDFEKIRREALDPKSKMNFDRLYAKFQKNDTLMTPEEYRYLYYGYMFTEDYDPYRTSPYSDIVEPLYYKKEHSRQETDTIMKYAELSLQDNPFDLKQMSYYIYVLRERKKDARANIWQFRLRRLILTILSSGDGSEENPWCVIYPAHEYNILNFRDLIATGHEERGVGIDFLKVQKADDKSPDGYYFDFSQGQRILRLKFGE